MQSWMNEENLSIYRNLKRAGKHNAAQQLREKCFSAHLLQLAGSKFLLHKLIQLPILAQCSAEPPASAEEPAQFSAEQPASLLKCMTELQEHRKTGEYKAAVERSQQRADDHHRLSKQILHASQQLSKAKRLSLQAKTGHSWDLSECELVEEYDSGRLQRSLLQLLREHRGIGPSVKSSSCYGP